ncbi:MAG: four helix bundle protein [Calditrichaeota bacterium]|nr:MAG: four helix bundle protein [Calditrichota bacterium]
MEKGPVKHFTDLQVWKLARKLKNELYEVIKLLPPEEKYNLSEQIRRCAISVTSNIAEGYGRYHYQENIQFCRHSRGSLYEIQDHLISCLDQNYISEEKFKELNTLVLNTIKTLDGYIRYLSNQKSRNR